jgi:hypothetical protein
VSEEAWPKVGASFGVVAAALLILTFIVGPSGTPPGFHDSARQIQSYVQDHRDALQAAVAVQFAVLVAFAWFLGSVFYRLRAAEPAARLSVAALVGGTVLIVGALLGTAAEAAAAYHAETLDAGSVQALWDLSTFGYLFFLPGFAVLAAASAALALRADALPSWLGVYSALASVFVFVVGLVGTFTETGAFSPSNGALGLIAFLAFLVWLLAMGVTLVRAPRLTRVQARPEASMS